MGEWNAIIQQLRSSYKYLEKHESVKGKSADFYEQKHAYALQVIRLNTQKLRQVNVSENMQRLVKQLEAKTAKPEEALVLLEKIAEHVAELPIQKQAPQRGEVTFTLARVPDDIANDVHADVEELQRCYDASCYRSCIILCGRLLEYGLHRIYFEASGTDILEKNPGIGLGTLIAKLNELNFQFEPGMSQQIHLINQIRIFSVHKKQNAFYPSREQTHATILYTLDALNKLFKARPS